MSNVAIEYSEKAFENVDNNLQNFDLMGGWVVKSPLTAKKLENYNMKATDGVSAMERGLVDTDGVYVIIKSEKNLNWLVTYYGEKNGVDIVANPIDEISVQDQSVFMVYEVENGANATE